MASTCLLPDERGGVLDARELTCGDIRQTVSTLGLNKYTILYNLVVHHGYDQV